MNVSAKGVVEFECLSCGSSTKNQQTPKWTGQARQERQDESKRTGETRKLCARQGRKRHTLPGPPLNASSFPSAPRRKGCRGKFWPRSWKNAPS